MKGFCNSQFNIVELIHYDFFINFQDYYTDGNTVDSLNDYTVDFLSKATVADKNNFSPQSYP